MFRYLRLLFNSIYQFIFKEEYFIPEEMTLIVPGVYSFYDRKNDKLIKILKRYADMGINIVFIDYGILIHEEFEPFDTLYNFNVISSYTNVDIFTSKRTAYVFTHYLQEEEIEKVHRYIAVFLDVFAGDVYRKSLISKKAKLVFTDSLSLFKQNYVLGIKTQFVKFENYFFEVSISLIDSFMRNKF